MNYTICPSPLSSHSTLMNGNTLPYEVVIVIILVSLLHIHFNFVLEKNVCFYFVILHKHNMSLLKKHSSCLYLVGFNPSPINSSSNYKMIAFVMWRLYCRALYIWQFISLLINSFCISEMRSRLHLILELVKIAWLSYLPILQDHQHLKLGVLFGKSSRRSNAVCINHQKKNMNKSAGQSKVTAKPESATTSLTQD